MAGDQPTNSLTHTSLRKPGKDSYTQPKEYRLIALLNTLGKGIGATIANWIAYIADSYQSLISRETGGWKPASREHAIHLLLQWIHWA